MKFDKVIMNPPFKGIIHLSILHKAMLQSNEVVNLSPLLWLEFPDSDRKEGAFLEGKIIDLTSIERDYTRKLFNARIPSDIGIYHIGEKGNSLKSYNPFALRGIESPNIATSIWRKVQDKSPCTIKEVLSKRKAPLEGYCIIFSHMNGLSSNHDYVYINGVADNGKTYKDNIKNQHKNETSHHIRFESYEEALNFKESLKTKTMKFIIGIGQPGLLFILDTIPFMKDYTSPWDDNRFYDFFEFTESEIKVIEAFKGVKR